MKLAEIVKTTIAESKTREAQILLQQAYIARLMKDLMNDTNPIHVVIINLHQIKQTIKSLGSMENPDIKEAHQVLVDYIINELMELTKK